MMITLKTKIMSEEEITALAREYAEELSPDNKVEREMIELDCLGFLNRVLNSYCLVEKEKVEEAYLEAKINTNEGYKVKLGGMIAVGEASKALLKSLFPEIAKEVEE